MRLILASVFCFLPLSALAGEKISATVLLDPQYQPPNNNLILVEIEKKTLKYFVNGELTKEYKVATGAPKTPTPIGEGYIRSKGQMVFKYQSGPKKGKLKRWVRLNNGKLVKIPYSKMLGFGITIPGYNPYQFYIHSTLEKDTVGQATSLGCIRMTIKDMLEFFPLVDVGTRIIIKP